jgi:hypothetical protein
MFHVDRSLIVEVLTTERHKEATVVMEMFINLHLFAILNSSL